MLLFAVTALMAVLYFWYYGFVVMHSAPEAVLPVGNPGCHGYELPDYERIHRYLHVQKGKAGFRWDCVGKMPVRSNML